MRKQQEIDSDYVIGRTVAETECLQKQSRLYNEIDWSNGPFQAAVAPC